MEQQDYQLSIDPNYVPNWTLNDALRELFQNAIDRQVERPESTFSFKEENKGDEVVLKIISKDSKLQKSSLLLGKTSKSSGRYIGEYGEGYKLALLVLNRLGKSIVIYNQDEIWKTSFTYSEVFESKVLQVSIFKNENPIDDLVFEICLHNYELENYKPKNLFLVKYNSINVGGNEILTDEYYRGMIFTGGLFVTSMNDKMAYGYNLEPGSIPLDRDRKKIEAWDLFWKTSQILSNTNDNEIISDALCFSDGRYAHKFYIEKSDSFEELGKNLYQKFIKEFGPKAIPVSSVTEKRLVLKCSGDYIPEIINGSIGEVLEKYSVVNKMKEDIFKAKPNSTPYALIRLFLDKHENKFSYATCQLLESELLPLSTNWIIKEK